MFAGLLNRGLSGSLVFLIATFVFGLLFSIFAPVVIERHLYPNLYLNYLTASIHLPFVFALINSVFVLAGAVLINLLSVRQEVVEKQNYFPVFIYMLIAFTCSNNAEVCNILLANLFVMISLYLLLNTYRREHMLGKIFEAAFWLGASVYLTISNVIYFPVFFLSVLIVRPFSWREWLVSIIGIVLPMLFYEGIAYLVNFNRHYFTGAVLEYFTHLRMPSFSEYYLPFAITLLLLLAISLFQNMVSGFGNTVKKQRAKSILVWVLLFSVFSAFSGGANTSAIILSFALPISIFAGDYLFGIKRIKITNTILAVLVLSVLVIVGGKLGLY